MKKPKNNKQTLPPLIEWAVIVQVSPKYSYGSITTHAFPFLTHADALAAYRLLQGCLEETDNQMGEKKTVAIGIEHAAGRTSLKKHEIFSVNLSDQYFNIDQLKALKKRSATK
jgi:hypothetical protein